MKRRFFLDRFILAAIAIPALTACSHPRDGWVMTPTPQAAPTPNVKDPLVKVDQTTGLRTVEPPKVEFLFVEDNSDSMRFHLQDVEKNIDQFVDEFSRNNPIDFHFAVTNIYDSRTYQSAAYQKKFGKIPHAYYPCGEFHQVKDRSDKPIPNKYFISSTDPNWRSELKNTMMVHIQHLDQGGPDYEETFSPVAAVFGFQQPLEFTGNAGLQELAKINQNHLGYRFGGDNAYKIVFFMTDANDDSNISPSELYADLKKASGGDSSKVWGFAAIVPSTGPQCPRDDAGRPYKIEEFLRLTNHLPIDPSTHERPANYVSLCSHNFGAQFAEWGKSIRKKTITQKIALNDQPIIGYDLGSTCDPSKTICVSYGEQNIPFEGMSGPGTVGFTYDANTNSVVLDPRLKLDVTPGAELRVQYTPIPVQAIRSGRVKEYNQRL